MTTLQTITLVGIGIIMLVWCFVILASFRLSNPRWYHCRNCGWFRNELGQHKLTFPPGQYANDVEPEDQCDWCRADFERKREKARQHFRQQASTRQ